MEEKKEGKTKNENNLRQHLFNQRNKFIIIILIFVFGNNIRYAKKFLIRNRKTNSFQPLIQGNKNFKTVILKKKNQIPQEVIDATHFLLEKELENKNLSEINKKRIFDKRYPLPNEINCFEHLKSSGLIDMMAFTSFLTKDTIFFEFASGCSSIIAKYYAKKSYAVEGNKLWYDIGIRNGLRKNLLFKDLKCDGSGKMLSWPGKNSNIDDWKNFIQAYKEEYNADVILIDGRFRVACALDIFEKIRNDTIVLLHECQRKQYSEIENYYDKIYKWANLCLFQKKKNIKKIPMKLQEKYWNIKV